MQKIIPRPEYLAWLNEFRDKNLIKVVTGLRRSGKSTVFDLYTQELLAAGVKPEQLVKLNFEELENERYLSKEELHRYITEHKRAGENLYVFLDEVQNVPEFEKVVDSLYAKGGFDIYLTGSTANMLSSEIATRLTGRYVEINILPLSFREFVWDRGLNEGNARRLFMEYLTYGGMPGAREFADGSSAQREYIESVFKTILEKDVLKHSEKGRFVAGRIMRYMSDCIGSLTNPKRISDRIAADAKRDRDVSASYNTVTGYLQRLTDCFFLYKADRYDIKGGELLKQSNKYYLTDFGFKYYMLDNPTIEVQQLLENVVFLELKRRRYKVATGKMDEGEVDFVVRKNDGSICYVQVAMTIASDDKLEQELLPLRRIRDSYPKYIVTLDDIFAPNHSGIKTLNVIDFLLGKVDL